MLVPFIFGPVMDRTSLLFGGLLVTAAVVHARTPPIRPIPVCKISTEAREWIGKRVTVEGYIVDLGTHGFVLVASAGCKQFNQLGLTVNQVEGTAIWRNAFSTSLGPKRGILVGVVQWRRAPMGGFNPDLQVERIVSIAKHEADSSQVSD